MSSILTVHVHIGKEQQFNRLAGRFQEAINKTNWPVHYTWYALVNGGEGSSYVLVLPADKWAE